MNFNQIIYKSVRYFVSAFDKIRVNQLTDNWLTLISLSSRDIVGAIFFPTDFRFQISV